MIDAGSRIAEDEIIRIIQEKMLEYTSERISHGTVLTYDELHLILGSVVQKVRGENGDFFTVKFTLAELKYGTQNYTRIIAIAERK